MPLHPQVLRDKLAVLDLYLADLRKHGDSMSFAWCCGCHLDEWGRRTDEERDEMTHGYKNQYRVALLRRIKEAGARVMAATNDQITLSA